MNLQCCRSNLPNKAKVYLGSPHNPENAVAPARTDEADATYEDVTDNTVPCVATAGEGIGIANDVQEGPDQVRSGW